MRVEITREAPCQGWLDRLLGTGVLADELSTPEALHVSRCRRCRAFLETLKLQGTAEVRYPRAPSRRFSEPIPDATTGLVRWLERNIRSYTELDLAVAVSRLARAILRLDPEVRREVLTPSGEESPGVVAQRVTALLGAWRIPWTGVQHGKEQVADGAAKIGNDLTDILSSLAENLETRKAQTTACSILLGVSNDLVGGLGSAIHLQAIMAELSGDEARAMDLYHSAVEHSETGWLRGCVLSNIARLHAQDGSMTLARSSVQVAIDLAPGFFLPKAHSFLWESLLGRPRVAKVALQRLLADHPPGDLATRLPFSVFRRAVLESVEALGLSHSLARSILEQVYWEIYQGNGAHRGGMESEV